RTVVIKGSPFGGCPAGSTLTGTQTCTFTGFSPFAPLPNSTANSVNNPNVGFTQTTGDFAAVDPSGRPLYPAIYVTDITGDPTLCAPGNTKNQAQCHDWQWGGLPIKPNYVNGTWKGMTRTVDKTKNPNVTTLTGESDPAKNGFTLAPGADPIPAGVQNLGYISEIRWNIADLIAAGVFQAGNSYRVQTIVHDGDQNKTGGDVGEACVTVIIPEEE